MRGRRVLLTAFSEDWVCMKHQGANWEGCRLGARGSPSSTSSVGTMNSAVGVEVLRPLTKLWFWLLMQP